MQFTFSSIILLAGALPLLAMAGAPASVSYDTIYDTSSLSTLSLSCSDGVNGLYNKYPTLGDVPGFPNVGATTEVAGWNSPNCGGCYKIYYAGVTLYVTAVDRATASSGGAAFVLSKAAMNTLTGGNAEFLGRVNASYIPADKSLCVVHV